MIIQSERCPTCGAAPERHIVAASEYNTWMLASKRIGKTCTAKDALEHSFPHMTPDSRRRMWDGVCQDCAKKALKPPSLPPSAASQPFRAREGGRAGVGGV